MKHLIRIAFLFLFSTLILNFRWVHAATATLLADPCNPRTTSQAQARVSELFGDSFSQPIIRCFKQPQLGLQLSHGQTRFAPFLPAVILIGPQGTNVDVMAHEWVHAELSYRMGFIKRSALLPTWVDEGLAMQVDHRQDYSLIALAEYKTQPELAWPTADAISNSNFFDAPDQGKLHHIISRCAVGGWLEQRNDWLKTLTKDLPTAITELTEIFEGCTNGNSEHEHRFYRLRQFG